MRSRVTSPDLPLPPDLARLRDRYASADRQQNERSINEIAGAMGWSRSRTERWMRAEIEAERWTKRPALVNQKQGWLFREIAGDTQPVHQTQADPGVHERAGRCGVSTDFEPTNGGRRRTGRPRKAGKASGR